MEGIIGRLVLSDISIIFRYFNHSRRSISMSCIFFLLKLDFSFIIWFLSILMQVRLLVKKRDKTKAYCSLAKDSKVLNPLNIINDDCTTSFTVETT